MPTYAVVIGQIILQSGNPITTDERNRAVRQLLKRGDGPMLHVSGELEVVLSIDGIDLKGAHEHN